MQSREAGSKRTTYGAYNKDSQGKRKNKNPVSLTEKLGAKGEAGGKGAFAIATPAAVKQNNHYLEGTTSERGRGGRQGESRFGGAPSTKISKKKKRKL